MESDVTLLDLISRQSLKKPAAKAKIRCRRDGHAQFRLAVF